jgi:hypothetical protein
MDKLAEQFTVAGYQVKVATQVATKVERDRDYEIVRLPILKSCVVIEAMGELGGADFRPRLSIVGGPERPVILTRVGELDLGPQLTVTGVKTGSDSTRFVARHRVMETR